MISGYWQLLKGVLIVMMVIIVASLLVWVLKEYEEIAITFGMTLFILAGIFGVIFIAENLYKLFKSWWGGPPAAST